MKPFKILTEVNDLIKKYPELDKLISDYQEKSSQLTESEILWNIITDYDDAWNQQYTWNNLPYPDNKAILREGITNPVFPYSNDIYDALDQIEKD